MSRESRSQARQVSGRSTRNSGWPNSTGWPFLTSTSVIVPVTPAGMSVKTFMASMTQTVVSGRTAEPTLTNGGGVGGGLRRSMCRPSGSRSTEVVDGGRRAGGGWQRRREPASRRRALRDDEGRPRGGGDGDLGPAAAQADLGRTFDEVDRRQVVPLHQPDEVMDASGRRGARSVPSGSPAFLHSA